METSQDSVDFVIRRIQEGCQQAKELRAKAAEATGERAQSYLELARMAECQAGVRRSTLLTLFPNLRLEDIPTPRT